MGDEDPRRQELFGRTSQAAKHVYMMIYLYRVKHLGSPQTLRGVGKLLKTTACVMVSDERKALL